MNKAIVFILGIVTGVILTIASLFIIVKVTRPNQEPEQGISNDGITLFDKPGNIITANKFKVMQVIPNGALAHSEETQYGFSEFIGPVVLFLSDGQNTYYDDQIITAPKGKQVKQIGTYQYETKMGYKTVPIVQIME